MPAARMRLLDIVEPLCRIMPEVPKPARAVPLREKLLWTAMCLFIFLVCSQIPLYGVAKSKSSDPFYWMRVIMASNRGTLMELGIAPIVTSGMVMQFLAGSKLIEVDGSKRDQALFASAQKLGAMVTALAQAVAYVTSGTYGEVKEIGPGNAIMLVLQLFAAGVIVQLMDDLLQKGHGLGSGISLFICTNICVDVVWKALSPTTIVTGTGTHFEGAIVAAFHLLISRGDKFTALKEALWRQQLPNVFSLFSTLFVFFFVAFFQGFRVDVPVKQTQARGRGGVYPIKLFYTSNTPIILQSALVSNVHFFSQLLHRRQRRGLLVSLLGQWQQVGQSLVPVGGLAYYLSPPTSLTEFLLDPARSTVYVLFVLVSCALFSRTWADVSGQSPRDVAKQLADQGLSIVGVRDTERVKYLTRYIPITALFGGASIGALTVVADLLGCIGSGTGILLTVTFIYQLFEQAQKEESRSQGRLAF